MRNHMDGYSQSFIDVHYSKLGAINKSRKSLLHCPGEAFEEWPFPFLRKVNGSKNDSTHAIWTIPVKSASTEHVFGLLVELLGCPNEGWAKSAYFGLLDLLQHGTEEQIFDGLKKGGIHAFRKLFSSNPHCSDTWDGFVAGLDVFDRLLRYSKTIGKVCVDLLHLLLLPVAFLYKQRRDSGGVISTRFSSQRVHNSPDKIRNANEVTSDTVAYSMHMGSRAHSSLIKRRTLGLAGMPFEPTLHDWLGHLEATVVLIFGRWSVEHYDTLKQVKRRFPTYDSCQQPPTCTKLGGKRKPQSNTFRRHRQSVQEPLYSSVKLRKPVKRQCGSHCVSKDSRDKYGPIHCFNGPPEERSGMVPNVGSSDDLTYVQVTGMPITKDAQRTDSKHHFVEDGKFEREGTTCLRQRAASIVGHVLRRLDASQLMTEEQQHLCPMHLVSSTTKDVSSTAELSTTANRWSPGLQDACDVLPMSELAVSQRWSINPSAKVRVQRRRSEDKAIIEELEGDYSNPAMDITDELSVEVGSSDEADMSCTMESSPLITEFSDGTCSHLAGNLKENTMRRFVLPRESNGRIPEVQVRQFAAIGSTECAEPNSEVSRMLAQCTPTLEWKISRKQQPNELHLATEHMPQPRAGRTAPTFSKDAPKTTQLFNMVWKSSNEKSSVSSCLQVSTKIETEQQLNPAVTGSECAAYSLRSEIKDETTYDSKQSGLLTATFNREFCTDDTFKANPGTSAKKAQGLYWKDPIGCNSRRHFKVKPRENTIFNGTEKAIARELVETVLMQATMAVNTTPVLAFDETCTLDKDRNDVRMFCGPSDSSLQHGNFAKVISADCDFPISTQEIIQPQKTGNVNATIRLPLESALKSDPPDIESSCSRTSRVDSETESVHAEVDLNSSKCYPEQDWVGEVKTSQVMCKHSANPVEVFQENEPPGRAQATANPQGVANSSQNTLLLFGSDHPPSHDEPILLSTDGQDGKPQNSIGFGIQTYPVIHKSNVTLGGLYPNGFDPQCKAEGLSCSLNGTTDQRMTDNSRTSIRTSVDSTANPLQFIRLYVNLKARASWNESTSPCPVVIDTRVTTSPPPQLDIGNSTGSSLERLASRVCAD